MKHILEHTVKYGRDNVSNEPMLFLASIFKINHNTNKSDKINVYYWKDLIINEYITSKNKKKR